MLNLCSQGRFIGILFVVFTRTIAAKQIAVLNFTNNTGNNGLAYLATALSESIAANLAATKKIMVVERTKLKNILDEIALQQTGLFEAEHIASFGKMLKAEFLLIGSYSGTPERLMVVLKVVKVTTGEVVDGRTVSSHLEKIFDLSSQAANAMLPVVLGEDLGYLSIESTPEGAEVLVDGALIGTTPLIDYKIAVGPHRISVVKGEYFQEDVSVNIQKNSHKNLKLLLGRRKHSNYWATSFALGYFIPGFSAIRPDLMYIGHNHYHWKAYHVGIEGAYTSLKHNQTFGNPFLAGEKLTIERRYRTWFVLADFVYYPFATAQSVSPYAGAIIGYANIRDTQLKGSDYETTNLRLDATVLGGKLGLVFLPQANLNFFIEARYCYILPKFSRSVFAAPTVTQDITVSSIDNITLSGFTVMIGFTMSNDK